MWRRVHHTALHSDACKCANRCAHSFACGRVCVRTNCCVSSYTSSHHSSHTSVSVARPAAMHSPSQLHTTHPVCMDGYNNRIPAALRISTYTRHENMYVYYWSVKISPQCCCCLVFFRRNSSNQRFAHRKYILAIFGNPRKFVNFFSFWIACKLTFGVYRLSIEIAIVRWMFSVFQLSDEQF